MYLIMKFIFNLIECWNHLDQQLLDGRSMARLSGMRYNSFLVTTLKWKMSNIHDIFNDWTVNTEHWSLNSIAIRHTRSCILSSQLFFVAKQTRRWSVRFIHHKVIETNLAARSHDPIMRIKLNCEQVFPFARSFWGEYRKREHFFHIQEDKKTFMLQLLLLLFDLLLAKKYLDKKQIDYDRLLTFIHTYYPIIPIKNYNYCFGFCTEIESEYAVQTEEKEKRKTVKTKAIR